MKVYWIEFTRNVAVAIWNKSRQNFKKWDKVIVWAEDRISILRLWGKIVEETELDYNDVFWKKAEVKQSRRKKAEVEVETETEVKETA